MKNNMLNQAIQMQTCQVIVFVLTLGSTDIPFPLEVFYLQGTHKCTFNEQHYLIIICHPFWSFFDDTLGIQS
jgi:hypothetical protein